jgi:hypothetical protein
MPPHFLQNLYQGGKARGSQQILWMIILLGILFCPVVMSDDQAPSGVAVSIEYPPPKNAKEAREELQHLLDQTLSTATSQLQREGTFFPFLAGLTNKGEIELVGIPEKDKRPEVHLMLEALHKAARQLAAKGRYRAVAFYVDYVAERKDTAIRQPGIRVELEHVYPDRLSVYIPYFINQHQQVRLMTPQFMPGNGRFFVQGETSTSPVQEASGQP